MYKTINYCVSLNCCQAFCEEGNIEENGVLAFAKFVIFSVLETRHQTGW